MTIESFGSLNGQDVLQVSLQGPDGMEMRVLTWGAVVRDLVVPSAAGSQRVVLGLNSIEDYVAQAQAFQTQLTSLIVEGVFARHPNLKTVMLESGWSWLPIIW